eukprot:1417812-Pleurochrysis_carterae.AAC.2
MDTEERASTQGVRAPSCPGHFVALPYFPNNPERARARSDATIARMRTRSQGDALERAQDPQVCAKTRHVTRQQKNKEEELDERSQNEEKQKGGGERRHWREEEGEGQRQRGECREVKR